MDKIDREIRRLFSAQYMSNKKWLKVIDALHESHDDIIECYVKLVNRNGESSTAKCMHKNIQSKSLGFAVSNFK